MKVCHLFEPNDDLASSRYRAIIPGGVLQRRGDADIYIGLDAMGDAVNVYHKYYEQHLRNCGTHPGIVDIVDDYIFEDFVREKPQHAWKAEVTEKLVATAKAITTSTPIQAERIRERFGVDATIIQDVYEWPERPFRWTGGESVMWFGAPYNMNALIGVEIDCGIEAITDCDPGRHGNMLYTPWSRATMERGFSRHDVCLLPALPHAWARGKSPNRIVNALRAGKFVLTNEHPAHDEFREFVWMAKPLSGLRWARANPEKAQAMVEAGQAYIRDRYSPEAAADKWLEVFKRCA